MRRRRHSSTTATSGLSLVEVIIASAILAIVVVVAVVSTGRESRWLGTAASRSYNLSAVQGALDRVDQELRHAQATVPSSTLTAGAGPAVARIDVASTLSFPPNGILLIDRGTAAEERIQYDSIDAGLTGFAALTHGVQCSDPSGHAVGQTVFWAAVAEVIEQQVAPAADLWDGLAAEPMGPRFFRGDGTGFAFRVPVDPAGGNDFIDQGAVNWGATVAGAQTLSGRSAIYYDPVTTLREDATGIDINGDGDEVDVFDLGSLNLTSWDSANPGQAPIDVALCPAMILQEQCNWGGDLDNDGFDDPMFLWDGTSHTLHVRLLVNVGAQNERVVTRPIETVFFLQNGADD